MIIDCPCGEKKFNVDVNLIPKKGRQLKCGSCDRKWFFKIEEVFIKENPPVENKILQNKHIERAEGKKTIIEIDKSIDNEDFKKINLKQKNLNVIFKKVFKNILIFVISLCALVLLIDTFKSSVALVIPNIDFYLNNLYQSLIDIKLFLTDLVK